MFKTIKKYLLLVVAVLALVCSVAFAACADNKGGNNNNNNGSDHECQHVCPVPECGKCTDNDCTEPECEEKCPGNHEPGGEPGGEPGDEHECQDECPTCHKCTTECTEPECEDKCPGNHEPEDQSYDLSVEEPVEDAVIGADKENATKFNLIGVQPGDYTVTLAVNQSTSMATFKVVVGAKEYSFEQKQVSEEEIALVANITIANEEYIEIYGSTEATTTVTLAEVPFDGVVIEFNVSQEITIPKVGESLLVKFGNTIKADGKYWITITGDMYGGAFGNSIFTVQNNGKTLGTYKWGTLQSGADAITINGFTDDILVIAQSNVDNNTAKDKTVEATILITEVSYTINPNEELTVMSIKGGEEFKVNYGESEDVEEGETYTLKVSSGGYSGATESVNVWVYDSEEHYHTVAAPRNGSAEIEITVNKEFGLKVVAKSTLDQDKAYNIFLTLVVEEDNQGDGGLESGPVEGQYTTATLAYVELDEKDSKYVPYDALLAGEHTFKTNAILITVPSNTDVIDPMYEIELGEDSQECVIIFYSWGYGMFKNGFGGDSAMYDGDMIPFAPTSNCDLYLYNPSGDTISFTLIDLKKAGGGGGLTPEDPKEAHVGSDSIKNMTEIYFVFTATQDGTFTFKFAEGASNSAGVTFMAKSNFDDWTGSTMYAPYYEEPYTREVKAGDKVYFIVNYYQYGEAPATVSFEISIA